jgi:hypothetical protein
MFILRRLRQAWPAVLATASAAAVAIALGSPLAASADTIPVPNEVYSEWQVGTPLPTAPAGYTWQALPNGTAMAGMADGTSFSMTSPALATPDASGFVNLVALPTPDIPYCVRSVYKQLGQKTTNVEQSYTTVNGISMSFNYGNGQSSRLGVGTSLNNPNGGFSASGTDSVSTNKNQGFPTSTAKSYNHWETNFLAEEIKDQCPTGTIYSVMEYKWAGGAVVTHPSSAPSVSSGNCVPEPKGSTWTQSGTRASSFSVGWSVLGFNASAQTGYSSTASIHFAYNVSGRLCGTKDVPGGSPGVLVGT